MPPIRTLGFICLALVSVFALALASVDQARVNQTLSASMRKIGSDLDRMVGEPALAIARVVDETLFDPPSHMSR